MSDLLSFSFLLAEQGRLSFCYAWKPGGAAAAFGFWGQGISQEASTRLVCRMQSVCQRTPMRSVNKRLVRPRDSTSVHAVDKGLASAGPWRPCATESCPPTCMSEQAPWPIQHSVARAMAKDSLAALGTGVVTRGSTPHHQGCAVPCMQDDLSRSGATLAGKCDRQRQPARMVPPS